jgi:hypothetical protein
MTKRLPIATVAATTALFMTGLAPAHASPAPKTAPPPAGAHVRVDKPQASSAQAFTLRAGRAPAGITAI